VLITLCFVIDVHPAQLLSVVIICQDVKNIEKGDAAELTAGIGKERVKIRKCPYKLEWNDKITTRKNNERINRKIVEKENKAR